MAYNETVEELTQSYQIGFQERYGLDVCQYLNYCPTWGHSTGKGSLKRQSYRFFKKLYKRVADGTEAKQVLVKNSRKNYKEELG